MKKSMLIVFVLLSTAAMAQFLSRRQSKLLEPLLPFAEAVEKAKAETPQGWYALAIHYARGEEIDLDVQKARQFMQKASDMCYSNAVFASAMLLEADSTTAKDCNDGITPRINDYLGHTKFRVWSSRPTLSITKSTDVAAIRAGYERAIKLGVPIATNELARFERRVEAAQAEDRKRIASADMKAKNAELAESLFQGQIQSKELSAPVPSDVFDMKGQTFKWEAGGKEGLTFDVLIRVAPLKPNSSYHIIEKATITIDKDGRIIKIEGKPERTRIKG